MGPIILVALTALHIPTMLSNNSTLYMDLCLSADQLTDILGIHMTITLIILSLTYIGNRLIVPHTLLHKTVYITTQPQVPNILQYNLGYNLLRCPEKICSNKSIITKVMLNYILKFNQN